MATTAASTFSGVYEPCEPLDAIISRVWSGRRAADAWLCGMEPMRVVIERRASLKGGARNDVAGYRIVVACSRLEGLDQEESGDSGVRKTRVSKVAVGIILVAGERAEGE